MREGREGRREGKNEKQEECANEYEERVRKLCSLPSVDGQGLGLGLGIEIRGCKARGWVYL